MKKFMICLLSIAFVVALCACTPSQKMQNKVYEYLNTKYKGLEFELVDYSQDKETSGRYIIDVKCVTNDVDFEIYASNLYISDGYSVSYANAYMEPLLTEALSDVKELAKIESVQWMDIFADNSNGYKFREVGNISYEMTDIKEIYRVTLSDVESTNEATQCIYMVITQLDLKGVSLNKIVFDFRIGEVPILLTTDTASVKEASFVDLEKKLQDAVDSAVTEQKNILFQSDPSYNEVSFFLDEKSIYAGPFSTP